MSIAREERWPKKGKPTGYDGSEGWPEELWPEEFWPEDIAPPIPTTAMDEISSFNLNNEHRRVYTYETHVIEIWDPLRLFIGPSGNHRVQDAEGMCHYIPPGWVLLSWDPKDFHFPVQF